MGSFLRGKRLGAAMAAVAVLLAAQAAHGQLINIKVKRGKLIKHDVKVVTRNGDSVLLPIYTVHEQTNEIKSNQLYIDRDGGGSRSRSAPYLLRDPKKLTKDKEAQAAAEEEKATAERAPRPPRAVRTTTLVGMLTTMPNGSVVLIVGEDDDKVQYALETPKPAEALLAKADGGVVRAVVIGKVNAEDAEPVLTVKSAWALQKVSPSTR